MTTDAVLTHEDEIGHAPVQMDRPGGTAGIGLDVGPGVRPHSGADLSTGTVDCGTLICPWHGLRSAGDWEFGWRTLPAHDDGVLAWVRLDTVGGEAPLDLRLFRSGPPAAAARRHPAGRGLRAR